MRGFPVLHVLVYLFYRPIAAQNPHSGNSESGVSPRLETRKLRRKLNDSNLDPTPLASRSRKGESRRTILQIRTTLLNVDIDALTPEQVLFFEDTWVETFNKVLQGEGDTVQEDSSSPRLRSFVVEEVRDGNVPYKGRSLASTAGRTQKGASTPYKWFDIWALMEASCRLCSHDDYRGRSLSGLTKKDDDSILRDLEITLCDALRQGPFLSFQNLQQCRIVYFDE